MANTKHDVQASDRVQLSLRCPDCGEEFEQKDMSRQEIEAHQVSQLPDREAMSLVNANLAAPINLAAALNVLSDSSSATAISQQVTPIQQSM